MPPGLTLPVALVHSLHAGRTRPGTAVLARTTQRILLPGNLYLNRGAEVLGTVIASSSHPASLTLRFTSLRALGQTIPLSTRVLAIAGFVPVSDTAQPVTDAADRANPSAANWTTQQVGGDQVVRSGWSGPVINTSSRTVGFATFRGVFAFPAAPGGTPRALGPFSAGSTGLFGYDLDCALQPPSTPTPSASALATVRCATSSLTLSASDVLLLETVPQP